MPFAGETASTEFVDGILIAGSEKLTEHLNQLVFLVKNSDSSDLRKQAEIISSYIKANNLTDGEMKNTLLISIGGEKCVIKSNV